MLRIFIQDGSEKILARIAGLLDDCFDFDWDVRIAAKSRTMDDILRHVVGLDVPALFILEDTNREALHEAAAAIVGQNALHYLVLRLNAASDAALLRPPFLRPCGFLVPDCQREEVRSLLSGIYTDFASAHNMYGGYFTLRIKGSVYRLPYSKILYFESNQKKVIARTAAQEFEFYDSLEEISKIAPKFFLRIHRGFLVNTKLTDAICLKEHTVTMRDGSWVPFSRTYKDVVLREMAGIREERRENNV